MTKEHYISLGSSDLMISSMGIGTWAWGDQWYWGYGQNYSENDVQEAFQVSLSAGINFFDTAEAYGRGESERILGKAVRASNQDVHIATKFFPYPWRLTQKQLISALKNSLKRLGVKQVALYQIHWPFPPISIETWMNALADAVELGLTQCVGVSNYNMDQMSRAIDALDKRGIKLASNQVVYNLLDRRIEKNGLLARCQEMNVSVIAYSPLAQGLLSGKYTIQNPPSGVRRFRYNANLIAKVQPLLNLMREMGQEQGGKTPTQIALNWVISKGAIPIPGVKNRQQAMEVVGALGWHLSSEQMDALDKVSQEVSL